MRLFYALTDSCIPFENNNKFGGGKALPKMEGVIACEVALSRCVVVVDWQRFVLSIYEYLQMENSNDPRGSLDLLDSIVCMCG